MKRSANIPTSKMGTENDNVTARDTDKMVTRVTAETAAERPSTWKLLSWLTSITKPVHGPLYVSTLFRIIKQALELLIFGIAGWAIVSAAVDGRSVVPSLVLLIVLALGKATFYYLEQFTGHYVAFKALEILRGHAFSVLWPKAPSIVTRSRSGDVLTSLTKDVDRIEVVYAHTFAPVVSAFVVPISTLLVTGALVGWEIVAIPAVCLAISLLVVPLIGTKSAMTHADGALAARGDLSAHVTDSVFGVEEVVGYGREKERFEEMDRIGETISTKSRSAARSAGIRRGLNSFLSIIVTVSILAVGLAGNYSIAVVCALAVGSIRFLEGPRGIEEAVGSLDRSLAAAHRLYRICHEPQRVADGNDELRLDRAPALSWEGVTYRYPGDSGEADENVPPALDNVTIEAPAGKRTVLLGPSGSGKTTTVQLLLRFDDPEQGDIRVDGTSINSLTTDSLRSRIALVSQKNQMLDSTIIENVRLGHPDATEEQVWEALKVARVDEEVKAMPAGLKTRVGQDGSKLSGGQGQRICLARALLTEPSVLILDEFTANLNASLEKEIRDGLAATFGHLTIVEVTHREEAAAEADHAVLFHRGKVAASGKPEHVLEARRTLFGGPANS